MNRPASSWLVASALALALVSGCGGPPPTPQELCAELAELRLGEARITAAESVAAGERGPAHCQVRGVIETEINFELLLPDQWNGRFMMGGGGGYVGEVQNSALEYGLDGNALERGYATVGTDTGHQGAVIDASWALDHEQRQLDFGYRAVHLTAETAKAIIARRYQRAPEYSYFVGCSRGGGQGMVESQRYPEDFDGIVAGAPAYDWPGIAAGFVRTQQVLYPDGDVSAPLVTPELLGLVASAVDEACDALDGVEDDVLADPRSCELDLETLPRCPAGSPGPGCATPEQVAALLAIYAAPRAGGEPLHYGFPFGGEADPGGWASWVTGNDELRARGVPSFHHAFGTELYKYFVYSDPDWDFRSYDFTTHEQDTARVAEILNATDTDLSAFRDAGGKLIFWTGWSDLALSALGTIDYYEQVEAKDPELRDYTRLFMLPGVLHCSGGPGPDQVDWLEAIRAWVEDGSAPERLVAVKLDADDQPVMTRPVCPYPQLAVYSGEGSTDDESHFSCGPPPS